MRIYIPTILAVSLCLGFLGCAATSDAQDEVVFTGPAPATALKEAASLYKGREDLDNVRKAISTLASARDMDNRNYEVEWRFAQYSYYLGSRKTIESEESEKVLKLGLSASKIAKRMEPEKPEGHFWYAAILGQQSKQSPITVGAISVKKIREAMTKVTELDPDYQGASAYDGLGQLEMGTRGLAGGSVDKAVEYYKKALEVDDNNSYTKLHLAEAYLAQNKDAEAKKLLLGIINLKPDPDFVPEHKECVAVAKDLLAKKF